MTIKDVAERCGVSVSTVSRVLNNKPDVSAKVKEKVMRAIEELHYVPNSTARDLVRVGSDAIGLVVRGVGNPFFTEIIPVIENAASRRGYSVEMVQIKSGEDELWAGATLARSKKLRGIIFLGGCFDYTPEQTAILDVPFVCCTYTNSFGNLPDEIYSSVTINDDQTAYNATDMLIKKGHKRIVALVPSTEDRSISELRYNGYCRALSANDIEFDEKLVAVTEGYGMAEAKRAIEELFHKGIDFSAIFAISDSQAIAAMKTLSEHGISVPENCSVVGVDGIEVSEYTIPTLTTLAQPKRELGESSVRILLDIIEGLSEQSHLLLETELREGGSVRNIK